jgi:hypothetical protein
MNKEHQTIEGTSPDPIIQLLTGFQWLLPKSLVKQIKQYALDNDTTSTAVVIEACNDLLSKRKRK